ncbi:MAG: hypothetical protein VKL39_13185 [Leptolyngbyaceae bacterium]|nr:hypothetical protein [Leptolyngbyaceae bacterium]
MGIAQPSLTATTGVEKTLYQTTYHPHKDTFYEFPERQLDELKDMFGYGSPRLYEPSKAIAQADRFQPLSMSMYEVSSRESSAQTADSSNLAMAKQ